MRHLGWCGLLVVWGCAWFGAWSTAGSGRGKALRDVLDARRFDYMEAHEGRPNAAVEVVLREAGGGARLEVNVSAAGPSVEPPPGWEGRRGGNEITARELGAIARSGRLTGATCHVASGVESAGSWREGARGRLPVRRLLPDDTIDHHAWSSEEMLLGLALESLLSRQGLHRTEWRVDGEVRLVIDVRIGGDSDCIVSIAGPDAPPVDATPPGVFSDRSRRAWFAQVEKPEPIPIPIGFDAADWERRDLEGRWVLLTKRLFESPNSGLEPWARLLAERREFELLELVALYMPASFATSGVGKALADAGAPQWPRLALWTLPARDSHDRDAARRKLLRDHPAEARAWLRKHADTIGDAAKRLRADLEKLELPEVDPERFLPPLDPEQVFAQLDAPAELAEFGDRLRAEPGKVYLHQVLRAIDGVIVAEQRGSDALVRLGRLTRHPDARVRRAALRAFSRLPGELVPHRDFIAVMNDTEASAADRETALLAASQSTHPEVYLLLLRIAGDPAHPAWKAAVSRLGDRGDPFTLERLEAIQARKDLAPEAASFLDEEIGVVRDAVVAWHGRLDERLPYEAYRMLQRAAWAEVHEDPHAAALAAWTLDVIRPHANRPDVRRAILQEGAGDTLWPWNDGAAETIAKRVKALVERL